MKRIAGLVLLMLAVSAIAQRRPPAMLLYDSSGVPFPTGSGTALSYFPNAFTCYTIVTGSVVPCTFSGGGGSGTVTSVTFTGDGTILSSTPSSAVTTSGTLTAALLTQVANCVLAGPTTGAAANPTCRALVIADIPAAIPIASVGSAGLSGTSPVSIASTGAIACATCVVASSPGVGIAHFAGSTQTVTSSLVNLSTATDVTGTLPAANVVTGTSGAAIPLLSTANTYSGASTFSAAITASAAGAASTPNLFGTGAVFTGGSGTTTFPYWFIQPTAVTAATTWSTNGTGLGMNLTGTGNFIDLHLNGGASLFSINSSGSPSATNGYFAGTIVSMGTTGTSAMKIGNAAFISYSSTAAASGTQDTVLDRNAAGVLEINAGTTTGSTGSLKLQKILTSTNCSNSASPAVCGSAAAGSVAIPTGTNPTLVVNTTAVTAGSQILLTTDDSITIAATTCNSTLATLVGGVAITARTAATSFTISFNGVITTNPLCLSYSIIN